MEDQKLKDRQVKNETAPVENHTAVTRGVKVLFVFIEIKGQDASVSFRTRHCHARQWSNVCYATVSSGISEC